MLNLVRLFLCAAIAAGALQGAAQAQEFPNKKIQLIVPYSAGSGVDLLARSFGEALQAQLNVPIVVENREGATGTIGSLSVARAPADGYTFMVNANPPFTVAPLAIQPPPYDIVTSFTPIARVGSVPLVLITGADSPVKTFAELKDHANANPGKANYASTGNGSPGQLNMESIKARVGMKIEEVPYKSSTQALTDVIGGHILASIVALPAADQLIQTGRVRVIAVGSKERLKKFPEVPTLAEAIGQPDFEASVWYGFLAPANVPRERIDALFAAISKAFVTKDVKDKMNTLNIIPELLPPAEFAVSLRKDTDNAKKLLALGDKSKVPR